MSFRALALLWFFSGGDGRERKERKSIHAHNKKLNVYSCSLGNWKSFHIPFIFNRTCIFQRSKVRAPNTVQPTILLYRQGLVSWPMVQGALLRELLFGQGLRIDDLHAPAENLREPRLAHHQHAIACLGLAQGHVAARRPLQRQYLWAHMYPHIISSHSTISMYSLGKLLLALS